MIMPQPLSHPDLRRRNLALLLGTLLRSGAATRKQIEEDSGLSKATVSRLVDELIEQEIVESAPAANGVPGRGRRPEQVALAPSLGKVIGVGFGLRRTVIVTTDLAHRDPQQVSYSTPEWSDPDEAIAWLAEKILSTRTRDGSPLRHVTVAVPTRVVGGEMPHPPLSMSALAGHAFAQRLQEQIGANVTVDSDANMALTALIAGGTLSDTGVPLLLNMGTVLTVSNRRLDGSFVQGRTDAFGDFTLIPARFGQIDSTLGAMLSTNGLSQFSTEAGITISHVSELWEHPSPANQTVRDAFTQALLSVLRIICVTSDPPTVLLVGRLMPLVSLVLPAVIEQLANEVADPPEIIALPLYGTTHSPAHGAIEVALSRVHGELCDRLTRGE